MARVFAAALLFQLFVPTVPADAQDPASHARAVAPFLDDQTLAIGHVDLKQLDVAAAMKLLAEAAPNQSPEMTQRLAAVEQQAKGLLAALAGAGIRDVYVVVSLSDVPQGPPFVVAPVAAGTDSAMAADILKKVTTLPAAEVVGGSAVAGSTKTLARLKTLQPIARPELRRAFERAGDSAAQLIFWPSDDTRRVLREMLPRLPDEIGGGTGKMLADGVQWGAIWVGARPKLTVTALVQSKDADAAAALRGIIVSSLQWVGKQEEVQKQWPEFGQLALLLTPRLMGDQLFLHLDERRATPEVLRLLAGSLQAMRLAAGRSQSQNNLKQIGVALHNYHDVHKQFPPQAFRSKEGKPLLSWRVAILPYVGQQALYKEFKLDEPWDSEHNRKLIEKMPPVYASPNLGDQRIAQGLTSYLAPLTKAPPEDATIEADKDQAVFDLPQGTRIALVTDGVSNTILVVEVHQKSAVPWTQPVDLVLAQQNPLQDLKDQPNGGFSALFGDGSVRFIGDNVDLNLFWNLVRMNDGQRVEF